MTGTKSRCSSSSRQSHDDGNRPAKLKLPAVHLWSSAASSIHHRGIDSLINLKRVVLPLAFKLYIFIFWNAWILFKKAWTLFKSHGIKKNAWILSKLQLNSLPGRFDPQNIWIPLVSKKKSCPYHKNWSYIDALLFHFPNKKATNTRYFSLAIIVSYVKCSQFRKKFAYLSC